MIYATLVPWTGTTTDTGWTLTSTSTNPVVNIFSGTPTEKTVIVSTDAIIITGPSTFRSPSRLRVVTSVSPTLKWDVPTCIQVEGQQPGGQWTIIHRTPLDMTWSTFEQDYLFSIIELPATSACYTSLRVTSPSTKTTPHAIGIHSLVFLVSFGATIQNEELVIPTTFTADEVSNQEKVTILYGEALTRYVGDDVSWAHTVTIVEAAKVAVAGLLEKTPDVRSSHIHSIMFNTFSSIYNWYFFHFIYIYKKLSLTSFIK